MLFKINIKLFFFSSFFVVLKSNYPAMETTPCCMDEKSFLPRVVLNHSDFGPFTI